MGRDSEVAAVAAIKPIRCALAAACALVGVSSVPVRAVQVETAALLYSETDRITAVEPVIEVKHALAEGRKLALKLTLDTLTGASPNGGVPSLSVQTYTRPSGLGSSIVPAGARPLDDTFRDSRIDFLASLEQRFGLLTRGALATSGDSRRFLLRRGVRYSHVLNPRTGWPVARAPRSVGVAAGSCLEAGLLSTLALLHGRRAEDILAAQGHEHWILRLRRALTGIQAPSPCVSGRVEI